MSHMESLIARLTDDVSASPSVAFFLNPYSYLRLRGQPDIISRASHVYADGILLVYLLRLAGVKVDRRSFDHTSMAPIVLSAARKLAIVGATAVENAAACAALSELYPHLTVVISQHGYFDESEESSVVRGVRQAEPDVVLVGLGTPLQELFAAALSDGDSDFSVYTCGGFLHQIARKDFAYYPAWIDRWNLRAAYRIFREPKLARRYALIYPRAVLYILWDLVRVKLSRVRFGSAARTGEKLG